MVSLKIQQKGVLSLITVLLVLSLFNSACKNSTTTTDVLENDGVVDTELSRDDKSSVTADSEAKDDVDKGNPMVCGLLNES